MAAGMFAGSAVLIACVMALVGLAVGVISGLLGIGGGIVMIPVFRLVLGLNALTVTSTSLFVIMITSLTGAATHLRNKTCVPLVGVCVGVGGACTSWLGAYAATFSPAWLVMLVSAAVIAYGAVTMFRKAFAAFPSKGEREDAGCAAGPGDSAGAGIGCAADANAGQSNAFASQGKEQLPARGRCLSLYTQRKLIAKSLFIGMATGLLAGYAGLGGGFIMVPLLVGVLGLSMKHASGTSLVAMCFLSASATVANLALGNVNILIGLAVAAGSIPGAIVGARLVRHVPERTLHMLFAALLLVSAAFLVVNELGLLG